MAGEARKSYEQFCTMAAALDLVGDRWTILIMRELLGGPARFGQLRDGLPGIAPNLLADRLRRLESDGLIRRVEGSGVYMVTEAGSELRTAIEELGVWGARMARVAPPVHDRSVRAIAMALQAILVRSGERLPDEYVSVEVDVEGELVEISLGPRPAVTVRPAARPDARVSTSSGVLSAFLQGTEDGVQTFHHESGDAVATRSLEDALGIQSTSRTNV